MALGDDGPGGIFFVVLFYFILPLFYFIFRKGDRGVVYSSGIYLKPIYLFSPPSPPLWMRGWICTYFIYFVPRGTSDFSPPPSPLSYYSPGGGSIFEFISFYLIYLLPPRRFFSFFFFLPLFFSFPFFSPATRFRDWVNGLAFPTPPTPNCIIKT